jgi:regulator of protease activity HflC (stomatin/prohibitin superfamily)
MTRPHPQPDLVDPLLLAFLVPTVLFLFVLWLYAMGGLIVVQPKTQVVVLRFGRYSRTITSEGISYVFPFARTLLRVTSSVMSLDLPKMMVLEANGSPIEVSGICAYRVVEAHKALLEVENFPSFVGLLASAVLKNVCAEYPYDSPDPHVPCLRKENEVITQHLLRDLGALVAPAGIQILQMRINDLTYAPEIAQSMLMRQQAAAMVDARRTIVEGAVATVCDARERMRTIGLPMAPDAFNAFALNLMLVLCSGERVQTFLPIEITPTEVARHG